MNKGSENRTQRVSPKKISAAVWLEIMGIAHDLSLVTTSTMVIGFGELKINF